MSRPSHPQRDDMLALGAEAAGLDRAVREDLEKIRVDSLLARQDASADLTRAMGDAVLAPLALAEIGGVLDMMANPMIAELEGMLTSTEATSLQVEKNLLTELLRDGAESQKILKRGLTFLKNRRYDNAVEWWSLNRRELNAPDSRLHLLLLIMESLTHHWSGDRDRAAALRDQVLAHQHYRALAGNEGRVTRGERGGA